MRHARLGARGAAIRLVTWWLAAIVLVVACQSVYLMRAGQWRTYWNEAPLADIQPESGFGFHARTGRADLSAHVWPSSALVLEDGRPLVQGNAPRDDIRTGGQGRYSFWFDRAYFSTADNSDPRTNGRRYTFAFPPLSRSMARALYWTTGMFLLTAGAVSVFAIRDGVLTAFPAAWIRGAETYGVSVLTTAALAGLVAIGLLRSTASLAPVVSAVWVPVLAINVLAAWVIRARYGAHVPWPIVAAFCLALSVSYLLLTVWAPHRSPGCLPAQPASAWSVYCVAPDSSSYYFGYQPGSTRQPLYPWFIGALTVGTGFNPSGFYAAVAPGVARTDRREPLFRVVHAQIILLLMAAVVASAALMRLLASPLPAVVFLALCDQQFLSAVELNTVLTEPLVQTLVLLLVATFVAFFTAKRAWLLLAAAALGGLAYLTRQAAAYSALMLAVMILAALIQDRRAWLRPGVAAIVLFAAICSIADVYGFVTTGLPGKQQESLQYQYRIARAMQHVRAEDIALMPDQESREWLREAIGLRDNAHREVAARYGDNESARMIQDINANLYTVATPPGGYHGEEKPPAFFMKVATPILAERWRDYLAFSFRLWRYGITEPGLIRVDPFDFSPWYTYAMLGVLAAWLRNTRALVAVTLIVCHWASVAIASLFAVPIPRMVGASEFMVVLAAAILCWSAAEQLATMAWPRMIQTRMAPS